MRPACLRACLPLAAHVKASTRRITLFPDGTDRLAVGYIGQTLTLRRCPAGE